MNVIDEYGKYRAFSLREVREQVALADTQCSESGHVPSDALHRPGIAEHCLRCGRALDHFSLAEARRIAAGDYLIEEEPGR